MTVYRRYGIAVLDRFATDDDHVEATERLSTVSFDKRLSSARRDKSGALSSERAYNLIPR